MLAWGNAPGLITSKLVALKARLIGVQNRRSTNFFFRVLDAKLQFKGSGFRA
jgi:hypothetical protein